MPSRRSKDDTWKEKDLLDAIKGSDQTKKKSSSSRAKESTESSGHRSRVDRKHQDKEKEAKDGSKESRRSRKEEDGREQDNKNEQRRSRQHEETRGDKSRLKKEEEVERERGSIQVGSTKRSDRERHRDGDKERTREKARDKEKDRGKDKDRERGKDKDRGKDRDRESGKDDRERGKDRDKEKDRERGKDKDRGKDRDRESGKDDRERGKDRDKEKDRSKDKEKVRERGKGRDKERGKDRDKDGEKRTEKESRKEREKGKGKSDKDYEGRADSKEDEKTHKSRSKDSKSRSKSSKEKTGEDQVQDKEESRHNDRDNAKHRSKRTHDEKEEPKKERKNDDIVEEDHRKTSVASKKSSILQADSVKDEVINDDYDYDDDDFEDYDDDFEEDDDNDDDDDDNDETSETVLNLSSAELEGVDAVSRAIKEENLLAESLNSSRSSSRPSTKDGTTARLGTSSSAPAINMQSHGKIDFVAAKQKQISDKIANKTKRRGMELSKLIELDVVAVDLFELKPMNIYEVYMKSFGRSNSEQVSVQTNEDDGVQETQTDEIEVEEKWCQFSNDVQTSGGGEEKNMTSKQENKFVMTGDTRRLNKFLGKASQVCLTLLDEIASKIGQPLSAYQQTNNGFSDGFTNFNVKHLLIQNRDFVDMEISPVQTNLLLTAYGPCKEKGVLSQEGLVCVWNSAHPAEPQKFLSCESRPTCCCFSPAKPSFVFAGMEDGSIVVWDLRESASLHRNTMLENHEFILRSATFSTAGVFGYENHQSPVARITTVMSPDDSATAFQESRDGTDNKGLSFQIASMEESGVINIWVVIEVIHPDLGGSDNDLGLIPGGKVKMIKSGSVEPQMPKRSLRLPIHSGFTAKALHVDLENANTFYVGTDQGEVVHTSRFGDKVLPKAYHLGSDDTPVTVTSVDHSPWKLPYMLASSESGSVTLFNTSRASALEVWTGFGKGASIVKVQWSRSKPSVFFALDKGSFFYVWDLLKSRTGPIIKEDLQKRQAKPVQFSLANDLHALGLSHAKKNPELVILYSDGSIHVHKLASPVSESAPGERDQVKSLLEEF